MNAAQSNTEVQRRKSVISPALNGPAPAGHISSKGLILILFASILAVRYGESVINLILDFTEVNSSIQAKHARYTHPHVRMFIGCICWSLLTTTALTFSDMREHEGQLEQLQTFMDTYGQFLPLDDCAGAGAVFLSALQAIREIILFLAGQIDVAQLLDLAANSQFFPDFIASEEFWLFNSMFSGNL